MESPLTPPARSKSEVNRTKGKVNFTADDVQAYYDLKVVGGMSPDEAAKATGVKFGLTLTVNPVGTVQMPPEMPAKTYGQLGHAPAEPETPAGPAVAVPPPPKAPAAPKKMPLEKPGKMQGKRAQDLPQDDEPEAPPPSTKTNSPNEPGHEESAYDAFVRENPEFATPGFAAVVGDGAALTEAQVLTMAQVWWADQYRRRMAEANGAPLPAFPALFEQIQQETAAWCHDPLTASHWTFAEYRRRGGVFLTEQQWAAGAIKRPGFWKKTAPFAHREKDFTDPSIPLAAHLETARRHPQGLRGALSAVQMFLNLGQAGPKAQAQLEKIKDRYQQELTANAERRDAEVKRTRERFATTP